MTTLNTCVHYIYFQYEVPDKIYQVITESLLINTFLCYVNTPTFCIPKALSL